MAAVVYLLCALTALGCSVLLLRGFSRTRARLLLWSGLCFAGLAVNNFLILVDLHVSHYDMFPWRNGTAFVSMCLLLYGLIWESR